MLPNLEVPISRASSERCLGRMSERAAQELALDTVNSLVDIISAPVWMVATALKGANELFPEHLGRTLLSQLLTPTRPIRGHAHAGEEQGLIIAVNR